MVPQGDAAASHPKTGPWRVPVASLAPRSKASRTGHGPVGAERLREAPHGAPMQSGPQEASTQTAPDEGTEERSRGPWGHHRPTLQPRYYNR